MSGKHHRNSSVTEYYDPIKAGSIDGTDTEPHDKAIYRALSSNFKPDLKIKSKSENTIFIARLNVKTTKETLKETFSEYGKIRDCRLVKDIVTGRSRGYAFIEYESVSSVILAYKDANQMELEGRKILVEKECQRKLRGWVPRRLGGGFGGNKNSGQLRFGGRDCPFRKPIAPEKMSKQE